MPLRQASSSVITPLRAIHTPSRQDDLLTQHLRDAARLLEIQLLDHIVLADGSYYSYSDEGTL